MVHEKKKDDKTYYICDDCGFAYLEKQWAEKCETSCRETKTCNVEVTKHAVQLD